MSDEWGPWIPHTPGPCPVPVGTYLRIEFVYRLVSGPWYTEGILREHHAKSENWVSDGTADWSRIVRYQIRTPPALVKMRQKARDIDRKINDLFVL